MYDLRFLIYDTEKDFKPNLQGVSFEWNDWCAGRGRKSSFV